MRTLLRTPLRPLVVLTVLGLGLFGMIIVIPMLGMFASLPSGSLDGTGSATRQECLPSVETAGRRVTLDTAQLSNAATIIRIGRTLAVPERGLVVAVATAMQESTLENLDHGDRDSVGLFQQRPSSGWGTVAELTDPPTSATRFYRALLKVPGWSAMPLTTAAQTVQRSAFPFAYAKWESLAVALVRGPPAPTTVTDAAVTGCADVVTASLPVGDVGTMLGSALAQIGDPYVWGATGPDAFDCSGLVVYAWGQAGFRLSVRTAAQMSDVATPVQNGGEQPGDLYFGEFGLRGAGAGHVMIVVRPGVAVQAPETGRDVEMTTYDVADHPGWRLGRLPPSSLQALPAT